MKAIIKRELRRSKQRIEHRLRDRVWMPQDRPMQSAKNIHYEMSSRDRAIGAGGIGAMQLLAQRLGIAEAIDARLHLLKVHLPYQESDHVLNLAFNALAGGMCIEDLELLRNSEGYLDAVGAQRIPDPTTAGDFCRRFDVGDVDLLQDVINEIRVKVWQRQPKEFFDQAIIDADGTEVPTAGECKEGIGLSYKGTWGYSVLNMSLANTGEPLFLVNRGANCSSQDGAAERFDQAIELVRRAGFKNVLLRGDTDFSQTTHSDRWDEAGVKFVFGYDARENLVETAESLKEEAWQRFERPARYEVKTEPRTPRDNVKAAIVEQKEYLNLHLVKEDIAEFAYRPSACKKSYRMIALRKTITVERGQKLLYPETRYFFYFTNRRDLTAAEVVAHANDRCDQENLNAHLKGGVRALRAPVDTLVSNWAYMVMTALAWSMKAWFALLLPTAGRWRDRYRDEQRTLLRMEFRTFLNAMIRVPTQIVRTGRRVVFRLMAYNRWLPALFRGVDGLRALRC
ncbi:MAG TPA: IS1380 family transposase [Planctomycetota bacterium]|nr:IS1380 family transposase [Planctomycetota bacterium]